MGNTTSQYDEIAIDTSTETATGTATGTAITKLTCSDIYIRENCNKEPNCIFLNNCKPIIQNNYKPINNIPFTDIISGIIEIDNQPEKYKLFLMINNKFNNILIKSIVINLNNCNNNKFSKKYYLYPECNLFITNQQDNEFSLKQNNIIHTFNPITSEIYPEVIITQEQFEIIKENDYTIKLIDIYNNEVNIKILNYPINNTLKKIEFNRLIQNLNAENINKTANNINTFNY